MCFIFLELARAFELFDRDRSGEISKDELMNVMSELGIKLSEDELDNILQTIDTSGKNILRYQSKYSEGRFTQKIFLHLAKNPKESYKNPSKSKTSVHNFQNPKIQLQVF